MEFYEVVRRRRMVRAFRPDAVDAAVLNRVLDAARRAPSAGHSQGLDLVVLAGHEQTSTYWAITMPDPTGFRWLGLLEAPVLVVPVVSAEVYAERYSEPDKVEAQLDTVEAWPTPYWWVDGGMAVENLLLACVDEGLGACFFGLFGHERAVLDRLGVPRDRRALGTLALGHPAPDEPGRSASRPRRPLDDVVHRGGW